MVWNLDTAGMATALGVQLFPHTYTRSRANVAHTSQILALAFLLNLSKPFGLFLLLALAFL